MSIFSNPGALRPLRPHQERALEGIRHSLASGHRPPMLQLPTGAGKTVIAANIIRRARAKGKRVAFAVSALSLIDQTVAAFEAEGTVSDMAGFHGELKWFAHERGYAPGWIAHKFRERFGAWPDDPRVKFAAASPPSLKTLNWVRSRQIAYAKGRAAHG
jgi:hypothetical protein